MGSRDTVALGWFGRDDADPRFDWRYAQEPGRGPAQVRITFEVGACEMTTLNTEELLSAALDADPGNRLLRYALADCLEESAGTVECWKCGGIGLYARHRGLLNFEPMECPNCSGTGRVSDGRRERAEGLRVLAQLGRVPGLAGGRWVWWGQGFAVPLVPAGRWYPTESPDSLPWEWRQAVNGDRWEDETNGARYPTRREAEDAAALAWGTLPADVRAKILGAGA